MKWKKGLAMMLFASVMLAACGSDEEPAKEDKVVEQEVEAVDLSRENEQFRTFATEQAADFVADTELLASHVKDGKLEEAQKLFPLVTMYYERLQPLNGSFPELHTAIYAPVEDGKAVTGFQQLAYGLFTEKKTVGYSEVAEQLVVDVKQLVEQLPTLDVAQYDLLMQTVVMLDETLKGRLATNSAADTEIYAVKAQAEAIEEIVKLFMARVDGEKAAKVIDATTALNEVVSFYELGKEDYIKYSLFTNTQKQELVDAVMNVQDAFKDMTATVK